MSLEQITQSFLSEASDIAEELETELLALEGAPSSDGVDSVFRALHTLKGSGSMFGFVEMAGFVHHFETVFEDVRAGQRAVTPELIGAALSSCDVIRVLLGLPPGSAEASKAANGPEAQAALDALKPEAETEKMTSDCTTLSEHVATPSPLEEDEGNDPVSMSWSISYLPAPDDLKNGARPDLLVEELLSLGDGTVRIDADSVPDLETLDPARSCVRWIIDLSGAITRDEIDEVFIFADEAEIRVERSPAQPSAPDTSAEPIEDRHPKGLAAPPETPSAPNITQQPNASATRTEMIRVPAARVDQMVETLGELVIAQSRLLQSATRHRDPVLEGAIEEVERLVLTLRESALSMRMLPVETVFGKFRRVVRDLSTSLGKEVDLQTRGGDTEVDKNVLDRLTDPLVHMLRNSLDHGLETPQSRVAAGKPAIGTVRLSARQEGGSIILEIADDGRGLDKDKDPAPRH